ncbi:MAG: SpoIIE family protein phosphatase [Ignavibacteriales bacterium]|nr:SpoIIE family protein phosphatase [Ignavibacteriales bacterium]
MSTTVSTTLLQEENEQLKRAVEELSILNDLARAIGASLSSQEIIQTIVRRSIRALNAEQGVVTLFEEQGQDSMRTLVRTMVSSTGQEMHHFSQALLGWMQIHKKPLVINDPRNDDRFSAVDWDASVHSLLSVPMMMKSELRGVITIYNKKEKKKFSDDDQRLLAIIAGQSAQVVENARLNEKEQALMRMQEEVRLASKIQAQLLPDKSPDISGYRLLGRTIPAQVVGGDYFDFIPIDEHRLAICLGDVSGKGLPASLLMANLQATLRSQTLNVESPKICLERSNRLLFQSTSPEKFATLFYGILNSESHTLSFSNAGQDPPCLLSNGKNVRRLATGGIPLGMLPEFRYEEESTVLAPGDTLVMYSDGVTEAMNGEGVQFGEERLASLLLRCRTESPETIIGQIVDAVKHHAGPIPQSDDITIVVLNRR